MLLLEIAKLLIDTAAALLGITLLLRAYMNWVGMPGRNPLAQFVIALSDWMVRPMRRLLPSAGRWDTASLLCAYIVALLAAALTELLFSAIRPDPAWGFMLLRALVMTLQWALYMVFFLTLLHVILGWVNPYAPVAPAISMLVRPFLAPFQRILPTVGGFDLSPIVLIVVVNIFLLVLNRINY